MRCGIRCLGRLRGGWILRRRRRTLLKYRNDHDCADQKTEHIGKPVPLVGLIGVHIAPIKASNSRRRTQG
jgi:hypothetical protein